MKKQLIFMKSSTVHNIEQFVRALSTQRRCIVVTISVSKQLYSIIISAVA